MSRVPELTAALWASHRRLDNATRGMTREQLSGPSYCSEWTIAQVMSHLGSGVQVMGLRLDAGLAGTEPPNQSEVEGIWAVWDAMTPEDQAEKSHQHRHDVPAACRHHPLGSARGTPDVALRDAR